MKNFCRILLEDEEIIVLSKPANMLAVPGREMRLPAKPRSQQWQDVIRYVADNASPLLAISEIFHNIIPKVTKLGETVPRQKEKMFMLFDRLSKGQCNLELKEQIWKELLDADRMINDFDVTTLPERLLSAADFADSVTGNKVFHVHRLDQETSGILVFAKTSLAASILSKQFREKEVIMNVISEKTIQD
jgi:hypothetical protein